MTSDASSALRTIVVTTRDALDAHEPAWNALLARSSLPAPLAGPAWFMAHLDHKLPPGMPWWCVLAYERDALRGVLPLVADERTRSGVRDPGEYFMHDGAPVLEPEREREVAEALFSTAYAAIPSARRIAVGGIRPSPVLDALRSLPRTTVRQEGMGAVVRIEGRFEDWQRRIGSNMRRNLRKAANRAHRELGRPAAFEFLTGPDAPLELLGEIDRIEREGWKGQEGGALGLRPQTHAFYADVLAGWKRAGFLEWHRLCLGGETAALHLAVRIGCKLTLARICFDEAFGRYSPSGLLLLATVERAFADGGIRRVDCVERQPWQDNWRMEAVPYHDVHAFRPGVLALLAGLGPERLGTALRRSRLLRRLVRPTPRESA